MLVLSRKIHESIIIGGNIRVTMTSVRNRQVRLAIDAPPEIRIVRQELVEGPTGDRPEHLRPTPVGCLDEVEANRSPRR